MEQVKEFTPIQKIVALLARSDQVLGETPQMVATVKVVLGTLTPREQTVIMMRSGLETGTPMALEDIGKRFRVTRERIRQIEAKAIRKLRPQMSVIESFVTSSLELDCAATRYWRPRRIYLCNQCHGPIPTGSKIGRCGPFEPPLFCSLGCQRRYGRVTLVCSECGVEFSLKATEARNRFANPKRPRKNPGIFCSRSCNGKWLSRTFGTGTWPKEKRDRVSVKRQGRPRAHKELVKRGPGNANVTLAIGNSLLLKLDQACDKAETNRSAYMRQLLLSHLGPEVKEEVEQCVR